MSSRVEAARLLCRSVCHRAEKARGGMGNGTCRSSSASRLGTATEAEIAAAAVPASTAALTASFDGRV